MSRYLPPCLPFTCLFNAISYYSLGFPDDLVVKNPPTKQESRIRSLDWEDLLEKEMATHYNILVWRVLWSEEPGGLQSMGSQRVGRDLAAKQKQHHHSLFFIAGMN